MQYDFWNNPLVVSAMRLKYRRSSPGMIASTYLLVLLIIGGCLFHYQNYYRLPPGRAFLLSMLSLQLFLSGIIAWSCVVASISAEVMNRTLDFQRIVSLAPREILMGKMLGEPALGYFLCLATLPFAILCWFAGSATLDVIAWFYVNIVTSTLLCAAMGTLHTYVRPETNSIWTRNNNGGGSAFVFLWIPLMIIPQLLVRGTSWTQDSWIGTFVNLFTPIGSLQHLYEGEPWNASIALWATNYLPW